MTVDRGHGKRGPSSQRKWSRSSQLFESPNLQTNRRNSKGAIKKIRVKIGGKGGWKFNTECHNGGVFNVTQEKYKVLNSLQCGWQ